MSSSGIGDDENKNNQTDGLSIFCREVRNLLRSKPNCMIPFSKFVPAYHNHYGRQCCVYQFGYTKLIELLESIPHVVQIIGDGTNRYITLTHREQIKRFASDLIKVVKSQPGKKLKLSKFARAYEQVLGRTFNVEDYGTNNINVLLAEIWEGTINIMPIKRELVDDFVKYPLFVNTSSSDQLEGNLINIGSNHSSNNNNCNNSTSSKSCESSILNQLVRSCELVNKPYITEQYPDAWFEIPKRERSDKEIKRTKYFIWDVIELLSNMEPDHSVAFSKFIPSYHYYFNRQCKVSIFGFSKLIDLFESISPDIVEIIDQGPGEEKIIRLSEQYIPKNHSKRNRPRHHSHHHHHHSHHVQLQHQLERKQQQRPKLVVNDDGVEEEEEGEEEDDDDEEEEVGDEITEEEEECQFEVEEEEENEDWLEEDVILPPGAIDSGPTAEELLELEDELNAYEELKILQSKRSLRMAAILDIFRYSIY